jgi:hypothetical protein
MRESTPGFAGRNFGTDSLLTILVVVVSSEPSNLQVYLNKNC